MTRVLMILTRNLVSKVRVGGAIIKEGMDNQPEHSRYYRAELKGPRRVNDAGVPYGIEDEAERERTACQRKEERTRRHPRQAGHARDNLGTSGSPREGTTIHVPMFAKSRSPRSRPFPPTRRRGAPRPRRRQST